MNTRAARVLAIGVAGAVLVGAAALGWHLRERRMDVLTDAETIHVPVDATEVREVLWQPAAALRDTVNSGGDDREPVLSQDGTTLLFVRGRAGADADLYAAFRTPDGWSEPRPVEAVNSPADELGPALSPDGALLYFHSDRGGGVGGYDLWAARRGEDGGWEPPVNLGPTVNTRWHEYGACLTPDGQFLCFASNRPAAGDADAPAPDAPLDEIRRDMAQRDFDLYESPLAPTGPLAARPLAALNSPADEGAAAISPFGDFIYFGSDRAGGAGGWDLYRARRTAGQVTAPTALGPEINTAADEMDPALGLGGFELLFTSDRDEGRGGHDVYLSRSREVFRQVETYRADVDWAAILAALLRPVTWMLLALLALLFLMLLFTVMEQQRFKKLSLLARCLLASLLIHMLVMLAMTFWTVSTSLAEMLQEGRGRRVTLVSSSAGLDLARQLRSGLTEVAIDATRREEGRQETAPTPQPASAAAEVAVAKAALEPAEPLAEAPAAREAAARATPLPTATDRPAAPVDVAVDVPAPAAPTRAAEAAASLDAQLTGAPAVTQPEQSLPARAEAPTTAVATDVASASSATRSTERLAEAVTPADAPPADAATADAAQPLPRPDAPITVDLPALAEAAPIEAAEPGVAMPDAAVASTRSDATSAAAASSAPTTAVREAPTGGAIETASGSMATASRAIDASAPTAAAAVSPPSSPALEMAPAAVALAVPSAPPASDTAESSAPRLDARARPVGRSAARAAAAAAPAETPSEIESPPSPAAFATSSLAAVRAEEARMPAAVSRAPASASRSPAAPDLSVTVQLPAAAPAPAGGAAPAVAATEDAIPSATPGARKRDVVTPGAADAVPRAVATMPAAGRAAPPATSLVRAAAADAPAAARPTPAAAPARRPSAPLAVQVTLPDASGAPTATAAEATGAPSPTATRSTARSTAVVAGAAAPVASAADRLETSSVPSTRLVDARTSASDSTRRRDAAAVSTRIGVTIDTPVDTPLPRLEQTRRTADGGQQGEDPVTTTPMRTPPDRRASAGGRPKPAAGPPTVRQAVPMAPAPRPERMPLLARAARAEVTGPTHDTSVIESRVGRRLAMAQPDLDLDLPTQTTMPTNPFAQRAPEVRARRLEEMGGTVETERAVGLALEWLARHQSPDGHWDSREFDEHCGSCGNPGKVESDIGLTGLSLLCFLAADHSHLREGPYRATVTRGIDWLLQVQAADGSLIGGESMYSHGIAIMALAEAYGMSGDERLATPVRLGADFIFESRNRHVGGWRYAPGQVGDTSVLGWQIMALVSARRVGFPVPDAAWDVARDWLDLVSRPSRPGRYAYQPGKRFSPAMSAEGMYVQQLIGTDRREPHMAATAEYLLRNLPSWENDPNTYYWYYGTLALFQHGGRPWREWNERIKDVLVSGQRATGLEAGSWDPAGRWSGIGGRVYQTAICTLTLEVYYRYLPLYVLDEG